MAEAGARGARRGRGRPRDAEATRARLLSVATDAFAAQGFDGARVDAIARGAGVNINLVYYYFGSKEGLFVAVMEATYAALRERHRDMELRALPPREAMAALVRSTFRMFVEWPAITTLLASENLHEARHVARSEVIADLYDPLIAFIEDTLARGAAEGVFREGIDPVELFVSINAEGYFYVSNRHTLGLILHRDLMEPSRLAAREAHIVDVILRFLAA